VWKHRQDRHDQSNPDFHYDAWKRKHMDFADAVVPQWVKETKRLYGLPNTKYACVGYALKGFFYLRNMSNPNEKSIGIASVLHTFAMHYQQEKSVRGPLLTLRS
jgi:hypothetical protein